MSDREDPMKMTIYVPLAVVDELDRLKLHDQAVGHVRRRTTAQEQQTTDPADQRSTITGEAPPPHMENKVSAIQPKEQKRAVTWRLPESLIARIQEEYEEIRSNVPPKERSRFTVGDAVIQLLQQALEVRAAERAAPKK